MSFFVDPADLVRKDFHEGPCKGTHVLFRAELSFVEQQRLSISGVGAEITEEGKVRPIMDDRMLSDSDVRKLDAWIKAWSFPKSAGAKSAPEWRPTIGDFERLSVPVARQLLAALAEHEAKVAAEAEPVESPLPVATSPIPTSQPESAGMTEGLELSTTS